MRHVMTRSVVQKLYCVKVAKPTSYTSWIVVDGVGRSEWGRSAQVGWEQHGELGASVRGPTKKGSWILFFYTFLHTVKRASLGIEIWNEHAWKSTPKWALLGTPSEPLLRIAFNNESGLAPLPTMVDRSEFPPRVLKTSPRVLALIRVAWQDADSAENNRSSG